MPVPFHSMDDFQPKHVEVTDELINKLRKRITKWNRQIPGTSYAISAIIQPATQAKNVFLLRNRQGMRTKSVSIVRFEPDDINNAEFETFLQAITKNINGLKIERNYKI